MNADPPRSEERDHSAPASVVHDLNNALTPVLAYAELLLYQAATRPGSARSQRNLEHLRAAADRARGVIRQLRGPTAAAEPPSASQFHNILAIITGFSELERNALPAADPRRRYFDEILNASRRAAALADPWLPRVRSITASLGAHQTQEPEDSRTEQRVWSTAFRRNPSAAPPTVPPEGGTPTVLPDKKRSQSPVEPTENSVSTGSAWPWPEYRAA